MTEPDHQILCLRPMIVEEEMVIDDAGDFTYGERRDTRTLRGKELHEDERFECDCGKRFDTFEAAEEHLRKARGEGDSQ